MKNNESFLDARFSLLLLVAISVFVATECLRVQTKACISGYNFGMFTDLFRTCSAFTTTG